MATSTILVIDDDTERTDALSLILQYLEYDTIIAADCARWKEYLTPEHEVETVVLAPISESTGLLDVFKQLKVHDEHLPIVVMVDANNTLAPSTDIEAGTVAKVSLPFKHSDLQNALQRVRMYRESRHLSGGPRSIELFRNLVGTSAPIREIRRLIEQVAGTDASVLLSGESGTGKEVVARNVHYQSKRRYKPFVPVNCGAIHPELLESELFGHEKGAFTGAISTRRGRFEMADGGTLFLDEIGDMPLEMQVKLLRVIQERCFEHVGSNKSISMDVRIIAASHVNLEEAIIAGKFREDLYYRLSVFPIEMPSLRNRVEDLPLLINDLINRIASEKRGSIRLAPGALDSMCRYAWPGNVRELANLIERLLILYPDGVVDGHDLPDKYRMGPAAAPRVDTSLTEPQAVLSSLSAPLPQGGIDLKEHLIDMEYRLIEQALNEASWVVAHAAKKLCLGRTTLVEKMRKFGLSRPETPSSF